MDAAKTLDGVDVTVNNAWVFRDEAFFSVSETEFDQLVDVNGKAVFFGTQVTAKRMQETDGGSVINRSGVAGLTGTGGYIGHCTPKGAVRLLAHPTADALGSEDIRVDAVRPGVVETATTAEDVPIVGTEGGEAYLEAVPSRRFGEPGNVADAALFLASALTL